MDLKLSSYLKFLILALFINPFENSGHARRKYKIVNDKRTLRYRLIDQSVDSDLTEIRTTEKLTYVTRFQRTTRFHVKGKRSTKRPLLVEETSVVVVTNATLKQPPKKPPITIQILLWIPTNELDNATKDTFKLGNEMFRNQNCFYDNCYLIPSYSRPPGFGDELYDAVIFFGRFLSAMAQSDLPKARSLQQKYIYVQLESNEMFPVCQDYYDDFFNWTITYKLDSDIPWPHFTIKNLWNRTVAPKIDMNWDQYKNKSHEPMKFRLKMALKSKVKMAAWFASSCTDRSGRMAFVLKLMKELRRYNQTLDILGRCGIIKCPEGPPYTCKKKVKTDYVFYLAMESSFGEDYITSKVLTAVQNNAIPIVYSLANYSRFLPPGSYLDGLKLGPKELAKIMIEVINNSTLYESFFDWRNYYSFESNYNPRIIGCRLCEKLNQDKHLTRYINFRKWWNGKFHHKCKSKYVQFLRQAWNYWFEPF